MKFNELVYERPNLDEVKQSFESLLNNIESAESSNDQINAIKEYYAFDDHIDSLFTLVSIRNSVNTKDEFYEGEKGFMDENGPELRVFGKRFTEIVLSSKFRTELEAEFGTLLFKQAEIANKTFNESIIPDLQEENKLSTEYNKLTASAEIEFDGKVNNLSQMTPYMQSKDRAVRHEAQLKVSAFFASNEEQFDRIYDDMVKVRVRIAEKLGYKNFIELAYDRLGRTDYNAADVKTYRDQIYEDIVPIVAELQARKGKRLGIEDMKSYDLALDFLTGNPTPKGDRAWQVDRAKEMYEAMHPETGAFFNMMIENDLLDLDSKPGKEGGGYCTFIPDNDTPFIFANFNGTSHDVDVLTHEAGHAFQAYMSRNLIAPYRWPTLEAAEMHSMSMEFLAWPYIDKFFEGDTDKYKFTHLAGALSFLPYGVLVDEFQHEVYGNPNLTPTERKTLWRTLEKKYLPYKDYDDDDFMNRGGFWFRQGHIFDVPFYYIDYTLAQVVAFQYWVASHEDYKKALDRYIDLCKLGGSKSFTGLIKANNLENPFKAGTVKKIAGPIKTYLDSVDDLSL